jgi:hypothetical protein
MHDRFERLLRLLGRQTTPTSPYWQNLYDKRAEWGPVTTMLLTCLRLRGLRVAAWPRQKSGAAACTRRRRSLGGWQVSGILSEHTASPSLYPRRRLNTNSRGSRADCIAPHVLGTQNASTGGYQWFDPNSYAAPPSGSFGSCGVVRSRPGQHTFDMSLQKQFASLRTSGWNSAASSSTLQIPDSELSGTGLGGGLAK